MSDSAAMPASLMRLAVVERQLIMQSLDIISLCRFATTCKQVATEALAPASGKFLSAPPAKPFAVRSYSTDIPSHRCALIRAHMPINLRMDRLDEMVENALDIESFFVKAASLKRIVELSLWSSPKTWTESDAMRVISLVPNVRTIWGVRSGSIWLQNARVRDALFSLPHIGFIGLSTTDPGDALPASTLALALQLHTLMIEMSSPPHIFAFSSLTALPQLTHLQLYLIRRSLSREQKWPLLPLVTHLTITGDDGYFYAPSDIEFRPVMASFPNITQLSLDRCFTPCEAIIELGGAIAFPALRMLSYEGGEQMSDKLESQFKAAFPLCQIQFTVTS